MRAITLSTNVFFNSLITFHSMPAIVKRYIDRPAESEGNRRPVQKRKKICVPLL